MTAFILLHPPGPARAETRALPNNPFQAQQLLLDRQPAGESSERAVGSDHAMARDEEGNRIGAARTADRPCRDLLSDLTGNPPVGADATIRNSLKCPPHFQPETGALQIKREVQGLAIAGKIAE
jgi:hypothetical protein